MLHIDVNDSGVRGERKERAPHLRSPEWEVSSRLWQNETCVRVEGGPGRSPGEGVPGLSSPSR